MQREDDEILLVEPAGRGGSAAQGGVRRNPLDRIDAATRSRGRQVFGIVVLLAFACFCVGVVYKGRQVHSARSVSLARDESKCDVMLGSRLFSKRIVGSAMCATHDVNAPVLGWNSSNAFNFLIVGDWGRDGFCCQRDVAVEMERAVRSTGAAVVINTGDNFYPRGVRGTKDAQIDSSFRDVYLSRGSAMLKTKWWSVLGNHDHLGDFRAVLGLHEKAGVWTMPDRWYTKEVKLPGGDASAFFAFIDTSPLFYAKSEQYMAAHSLSKDDGVKQLPWLEQKLASSKATWKFVVGHHPVTTSGSHADEEADLIEDFRSKLHPILQHQGVAAYICGHDHDMQHLKLDDVEYVVSGAGSKVRRLQGLPGDGALFGIGEQGFILAKLSATELHLRFFNYYGAFVYELRLAHRSK
mmetsp:Transcript_11023/g.29622  ORF Transcript_11023/g.29622 Transcript_11023/m.29622 type:complete len:409 (-) Transcript_11023:93-1319(-)